MQYYKRYFELVDFALKPAGATVVITSSTFPEGRYTGYQYVHPRPSRRVRNHADTSLVQSGRLHAAVYVAQLLPAERDGAHRLRVRFLRRPLHARGRREPRPTYVRTPGQTQPILTRPPSVPADYPRTLRTWGRRLHANQWALQETLAARHPALRDRATYGAFLRKWEYLFAYAAAGFAKGYITCHMLTFVRAVRAFLSGLRCVACADADDTIPRATSRLRAIERAAPG